MDTPSPQPCAQTLSCPEFSHSEASLDRATEDDALLKGNVPSAHDWKDAWSVLLREVFLENGRAHVREEAQQGEGGAPGA